MSAEPSLPSHPIPNKDASLQSSSPTPEKLNAETASTSLSSITPLTQLPISSQLSASKSMPPPPPPQIQTISTSTLPLQASEVPPTPSAPRPNFTPFFTLIHDSTTQSTHHPSRIHYIFSDDDESEVLTAACIRSLQQEDDDSPTASRELGNSEKNIRESETSSSSSATFKKSSEKKKDISKLESPVKREERAVIVDINETGDGIISTSSLSSCWQIVNAEIMNAPTFDNDNTGNAGEGEEERGLMLKIEGVGIGGLGVEEELDDSGEKRRGKGIGESSLIADEAMQALMEGFDRKMGLLRKIAMSGENWNEARKPGRDNDEDAEAHL
ncbi:hypothetical protein D0Z07_8700 [Hyphodiscus hymeniophilus]|uniref:Uncharacterized protein n=1 Tax=Hyphodiscus hymeniophilus TaxID=353542 RepID=A0A9P6VCC5_9HELO|nr:hypothetical protein D0Z07_8700 [Hyphodiscus hymeniophilus]